jgi:PAS domain S-box-containing protein
MTAKKSESNQSLRRRAEEKFNLGTAAPQKVLSLDEVNLLLHELQVHQIELDMQNEELRRTQLELDAARARYFDLFDLAPVGYFSINEKGLILEANLAAAAMLGVSRNTFANTYLSSFVLREDQDKYYQYRKLLLESGAPQPLEVRLVTKDGSAVWILMEATMSRNFDGVLVSRVVVSNIADRKRAEEVILKLKVAMDVRNTELATLNKELEAFAYSISHDLRAPLRHISGFSKILYEDYADKLDAQGGDYLARIKNGSDRMSQLIKDLLRLSHISRQQVELMDYDLSELASSVLNSLLQNDPARNVEVVIAKGLRAAIDPNLMRIAFTNLFDNAWKFTSKTEKARIEFGAVKKDGKTIYFVKDNGAGFDPTYAEKMFLPFRRLHSEKEFEGTGIGLAIVERIISRHEGRVWAEGEADKGATVYFTLGV